MGRQRSNLRHVIDKCEKTGFLLLKNLYQRAFTHTIRDAGKSVVFVAGVQRSGTNMIMNVLERSLQTEDFHETDPRAFDGYEMRSRETLRSLVARSPAPCVVVKALCELQELRSLLDDFAPAKAVWIVRSFDDVVNSHLKLWTGMPESIRLIVEDGEMAGWRGRGMSEATRAILHDHYHPGLDNASACALFWYFRNVLFFEQGLDRDSRVRLVRYEPLVSDPQPILSSIFSFLDLQYTQRVSSRVFSSSVRKAPAPKIAPAIRELCLDLAQRLDRTAAISANAVSVR